MLWHGMKEWETVAKLIMFFNWKSKAKFTEK